MSLWVWLLIACALAYAWKLVGYLVPARLLENPRMSRIAGTMTIGLLASLTVVNAVASGQSLAVDARLGALAAAAIALALRAPFLVVVVAGAGTAALLRMLGWN
jgi:Branched-chain amino acid transport protein (AzlD)